MIKVNLKSFCKKNQFILVIGVISFAFFPLIKNWKADPFTSDVDQYYSYIVALFIHNDLSFSFPNPYWLHTGPIGYPIQKMSLGIAILYLPLFLVGHGIALLFNVDPTGYTAPYSYSIAFGTIIYVLIGLHYLRSALLYYFPKTAVNATILCIYFGTNLLYYTIGWGLMSHSYLFFMMCIVIYGTHHWYQTHQKKHIIAVAFFIGLMTVSRPIEIAFLLFPLLFGINSIKDFKYRIKELWTYRIQIIIAAIFFLVPFLPQLLYWKTYADSWIYFSYGEEGFFFDNPHIWEVLFSFRKGLFIYTPIILFSFIGLAFSFKKKYFIATTSYIVINLFLVSSWWCWWYGGSFGMRALIQSFAVLAFPMAFVLSYLFNRLKKITIGVISFFILFSIIQTYQYSYNFINWDSMTKKAYTFSLFNFKYNKIERAYFNHVLVSPDYDAALTGKRDKEMLNHNSTINFNELLALDEFEILDQKHEYTKPLKKQRSKLKLTPKDSIQFNAIAVNIGKETIIVNSVVDIYSNNHINQFKKQFIILKQDKINLNQRFIPEVIQNTTDSIKCYFQLINGEDLVIYNKQIITKEAK